MRKAVGVLKERILSTPDSREMLYYPLYAYETSAEELINIAETIPFFQNTQLVLVWEAEKLKESARISLSETAAFNAALARPVDAFGTIAVSDGPDLNSRIRIAPDTTVPGSKLLTILVDVWHDTNGDRRSGTDEPSESLRTQWASP